MDRNLQAFLSVVEHKNLVTAADRIGLTQPSVTKRLQNMENEIGGALFDRSGREMVLTSAGRQFYRRAKRIEQEYLQAKEEMRILTAAGLDILRIGAGPLFHIRFAPIVFSKLHKEYESLQLEMRADTNERTIPMLAAGELDLVLGTLDQPASDIGLMSIPVTSVEQAVVLPSSSPLAKSSLLTDKLIRDLSWVIYGGDKFNEQWLCHYFSQHDLGAPKITLRTSSFSTGLEMVRSGDVAMMAPLQLKPFVSSLGLKITAVDPPISRRKAGIYVRPSSIGIGAIDRFIELLRSECERSG